MRISKGRYTADFETTTDRKDCRVWAWAACNVFDTTDITYGNNIQEFLQWCDGLHANVYFHTLEFDGEFILVELFRQGYTWSEERHPGKGQFTTLISDTGLFYSIEVAFQNSTVTFYDSYKIVPFRIAELDSKFGLPIQKLSIDYKAKRGPAHIITLEEREYIRHDVQISAMALKEVLDQGLTKFTQGSNAMQDYKRTMTPREFKRRFPPPPKAFDAEMRQAYYGAHNYLVPRFESTPTGPGISLDVNSMYSYVMRNMMLPYGEGIFFHGEYQPDQFYNTYIQMLTCNFELKPGHVPTIRVRKNPFFDDSVYQESSHGHDVALCMTSVDIDLMKEHYNVYNIEYAGGWKFRSANTFFRDYIDKWYSFKVQATIEGNAALRTLAKLMLNALYGKFALNPDVCSKIPYDFYGTVRYRLDKPKERKPVYLPVACFTTAYARQRLVEAAQSNYDRLIYTDADCIKLTGRDVPTNIPVNPIELGAWKVEHTFEDAFFVRQKCYVTKKDASKKEIAEFLHKHPDLEHHVNQDLQTILKVTCAGMPEACHRQVTWENFHVDAKYRGKLKPHHVRGGIVLEELDFTIQPYYNERRWPI